MNLEFINAEESAKATQEAGVTKLTLLQARISKLRKEIMDDMVSGVDTSEKEMTLVAFNTEYNELLTSIRNTVTKSNQDHQNNSSYKDVTRDTATTNNGVIEFDFNGFDRFSKGDN